MTGVQGSCAPPADPMEVLSASLTLADPVRQAKNFLTQTPKLIL